MSEGLEEGLFAPEGAGSQKREEGYWKVLIVDDEQEVHDVTRLVLSGFTYESRGLRFLSAYSGEEAFELLKENPDTALILLDVVMESDDAGLQTVKKVRQELENRFVRIVLRTGQPGQLVEKEVICEYDINGYEAKNELTAQKLFITLVASLRSFRDIITIERNRQGVKEILETSSSLFGLTSFTEWSDGVLAQLGGIVSLDGDREKYAVDAFFALRSGDVFLVVKGVGKYGDNSGKALDEGCSPFLIERLERSVRERKSVIYQEGIALYIMGGEGREGVIWIEYCEKELCAWKVDLMEVFCQNASAVLNNLSLSKEFYRAREVAVEGLLYLTETGSGDNSAKAREMRHWTEEIAKKLRGKGKFYEEIDDDFLNNIGKASILHNIGLAGVPEEILLEPRKLSEREFEEVKKHSAIGANILNRALKRNKEKRYLQLAVEIAESHREKFNGEGYPGNLCGKEIPLGARIVAVVDLYQTLKSNRPYRKAWENGEAIGYLKKQSGEELDPEVVETFLEIIENEHAGKKD